jgi:hypothetical protein
MRFHVNLSASVFSVFLELGARAHTIKISAGPVESRLFQKYVPWNLAIPSSITFVFMAGYFPALPKHQSETQHKNILSIVDSTLVPKVHFPKYGASNRNGRQ